MPQFQHNYKKSPQTALSTCNFVATLIARNSWNLAIPHDAFDCKSWLSLNFLLKETGSLEQVGLLDSWLRLLFFLSLSNLEFSTGWYFANKVLLMKWLQASHLSKRISRNLSPAESNALKIKSVPCAHITIKFAMFMVYHFLLVQKFIGSHLFCTHKPSLVTHSEFRTIYWYWLRRKRSFSFPILHCLLEWSGHEECIFKDNSTNENLRSSG